MSEQSLFAHCSNLAENSKSRVKSVKGSKKSIIFALKVGRKYNILKCYGKQIRTTCNSI